MKLNGKIRHFFTLMEIVVCLTVFLILISIILSFYNTIFKSSTVSNNQSMVFENARTALDIIARDIQCIYYRNGETPLWHKGETTSWSSIYDNDLLAFISATPLPHSETDSSLLCEIKYQLYNDPSPMSFDTNTGWIMRSVTGDSSGSKWNFNKNFNVAETGSSNAYTANDDSGDSYQRLTPYVTELRFDCYDNEGSLINPSENSPTSFPYSILVTLSLMDNNSWNRLKSILNGRAISSNDFDIWSLRVKNQRTFTKTIFVGERGQ